MDNYAAAPRNDGMAGAADTSMSAQMYIQGDPATTTDGTDPATKTLTDLKKMFDDYRTTSAINRQQALIDYDYYDGKQLTPEEAAVLIQRGQPQVVVNRTRVAINGILGVIARSATDPKCWPRNPEDDNSSSVATDCLRFVAEREHFNRMKVEASKDCFIGGTTAVLVGIDDDMNVTYERIHWEEFFCDPRSRRVDCSDARYMGIAKWMFVDDVVDMYPDQSVDLENVTQGGSANLGASDESFEDRPINQGWIDQRNKRCMVVEMYYRTTVWVKAVFYYGGILEQGESPFRDDKGKPICPIEAVSCYIDRDNNRYGMIRDMRDLQDEINKRRSKLLNLINNSQIQARDPSAIEVDAETARLEAARPDGVIPYGWVKVPTSDMAQGQMLLLTEAKNEMERFGPNPAVLGRQGADSSGRALLARQQGGLVELAVPLDQLQDWELRIYKASWARMKQYWKDPQWIRVTSDQDSPKFVQINQPIQGTVPETDPQTGQPVIEPLTGKPKMQPGILGYSNLIAEMDVDIIIDVEPATATILQEQFKDLMDLVASNPLYAQQIPFSVMIDMMPGLPNKRRIVQKLQALEAQHQQEQQGLQQQEHAIQVATAQGTIADKQTKAMLNRANAAKAIGEVHARAAEVSTAANSALMEATIAHDERNLHTYETLIKPAATSAEQDAGAE